jgi:N6-L-threonylcarbamoyladenine synthase
MLIFAIESSCDETSAAVVRDGRDVVSLVIASQVEEHARFGGVVPELASRGHLRKILPVVGAALAEADLGQGAESWRAVDAIAVTSGPGLIGSLLVGCECAKSLAWLHDKPLLPTHHLAGHIDSPHLVLPAGQERRPPDAIPRRDYPALALIVSGGHTALYRVESPAEISLLGETLDDAVGEAYDKIAKLLGLGYPGGPVVDARAARGRADAYNLARPLLDRAGFDFSYSGLKTSLMVAAGRAAGDGRAPHELDDVTKDDLCASFQEAAVDVLVARLRGAIEATGVRRVVVAGGVACNSRLRTRLGELAGEAGATILLPPPLLCTDNAAMIAGAAWARLTDGDRRPWRDGLAEAPSAAAALRINARATWPLVGA